MGVDLQPWRPGIAMSSDELAAVRACESLVIAFCERIDAGDVRGAVELNTADILLYDVARPEPLVGHDEVIARLTKVRFSYDGRETLHVPSNIQVQATSETTCQGSFLIALYDLVRVEGGRGIGAKSTELLGYAQEKVTFRLDDGAWRFASREVAFLSGAKRLPIGTLPSGLPFSELS